MVQKLTSTICNEEWLVTRSPRLRADSCGRGEFTKWITSMCIVEKPVVTICIYVIYLFSLWHKNLLSLSMLKFPGILGNDTHTFSRHLFVSRSKGHFLMKCIRHNAHSGIFPQVSSRRNRHLCSLISYIYCNSLTLSNNVLVGDRNRKYEFEKSLAVMIDLHSNCTWLNPAQSSWNTEQVNLVRSRYKFWTNILG